jgi:hypothetical protein
MSARIAIADRRALAVIGLVMGAIALAIIAIAAAVVQRHLDGRLPLAARPGHTGGMTAALGIKTPDLAVLPLYV